MNKLFYSLAFTALVIGGFVLVSDAEAQNYQIATVPVTEENDFAIEPGRSEVLLNPGDTVVRYISVTNRIGRKVDFAVELEDFVGSKDPADQRALILLGSEERGPYSLRDYLSPGVTEFSLEFGQKITMPITISIPENAEPGGFYGAVIISNRPSKIGEATEGGQAKTISRLGSLFLVRVNGETVENGELRDFKTIGPKKGLYQNGPEGFEILYSNTGSVHLVPYGEIAVKNIIGKTVRSIAVDAYFALPDSLRYREIKWDDRGFMLGRYTATLMLNRGYGSEWDEMKVSFWVLPVKIVLPAVIFIFLLVSLVYYIGTRFEFKRKS